MCLHFPRDENSSQVPEPLNAYEDIEVFKVLRLREPTIYTVREEDPERVMHSPFRLMTWRLGGTRVATLAKPERRLVHADHDGPSMPTPYWAIEEGLHAMRTKQDANKFIHRFKTEYCMGMMSRGGMPDLRVFLAVIPKYAKYFIGVDGDIAASQMTIVREIQ